MSHITSRFLLAEDLSEALALRGYGVDARPEYAPGDFVHRAWNGLSLNLRFGDEVKADKDAAVVMLHVAVRAKGDVRLATVNRWKISKLFGRPPGGRVAVMLDMDLIVIGGVTPDYVAAYLENADPLSRALVADARTKMSPLTARTAPEPLAARFTVNVELAVLGRLAAGQSGLIFNRNATADRIAVMNHAQTQIEVCDRLVQEIIPELALALRSLADRTSPFAGGECSAERLDQPIDRHQPTRLLDGAQQT